MHDTYTFLRHLADSWVLLALFAFFLGTVLFAWRPGSRPLHEDAGRVPFRHEDRPATNGPATDGPAAQEAAPEDPAPERPVLARRVPACGQDCGHCTCDLLPEGTK